MLQSISLPSTLLCFSFCLCPYLLPYPALSLLLPLVSYLKHYFTLTLCHLTSLGYSRAFYELFEGAIYMHRAKQFLVHKLDLGSKRALCKPARVGYYTACRSLSMLFPQPLPPL